jgi:hypothetical protein
VLRDIVGGAQDGDLYIWSSGTVTARVEKAHKTEVTYCIPTCSSLHHHMLAQARTTEVPADP